MNSEQPDKSAAPSKPTDEKAHALFGKDISAAGFQKALVLLVLLGLVLRIAFYVEHANTPSFGVPTLDQKYYDTVAKMLLAGEDLHELRGFRPLLYPMFLAAMYKLGGAWGVDLALFVQHLMGIATGVLVALMGARIFRHRLSGIIGGMLFMLAPLPLFFEGELLIEPSYIFLIFLGLWLHLRTAETKGWKSAWLWLACGGMTVLASQARANILVFLAIYPLFAAWRWWQTRKFSAWLPLLGLVGALGMMIPWGIINLKQADKFHLVTNAGGVNFYLGNRHTADGMFGQDVVTALSDLSLSNKSAAVSASSERYEDLVEVWAREVYAADMRAQGREPETDPKAISQYWTHRTMAEIKADPATWLRLLAKKSWLMVWHREVPNNKDFAFVLGEYFWLRVLPVRWIVLLLLAPAGIWAATRLPNRDGLFIVLVYAGIYSAGNVAFFICDRYRYPIWPAMAILAGGGLLAGIEIIRRRRWLGIACVVAGMALMAAISLPNWFGVKLPNFAQDYFFRSSASYDKGHFAEALLDVDRSLKLDALNAGAVEHRGNILFALNRLPEARDAYVQTLKLIPGNSGVWNNLGVTDEMLGATNDALAAFQRATDCKPPNPLAFLGMAFIQIRASQLDAATATLDRLAALQPNPSLAALAVRSIVERRRGHVQQADQFEQQVRARDAGVMDWAIERVTKP
jgi:tetratricopeptide (TPR) repeat protein